MRTSVTSVDRFERSDRALRPPQWATKAMNRATADNQTAQSEKEGLEPTETQIDE